MTDDREQQTSAGGLPPGEAVVAVLTIFRGVRMRLDLVASISDRRKHGRREGLNAMG